jgi:hypothetical protein
VRAYAEERAVEAADGEELPDIAAGDGPAGEARAAGDGEARGGELDEGLDLGGLLGRALAEEAHGCLCLLSFGSGARRRLGGGGLVMLRVVGWRRSSYTGPWTGARRLRNRTCLCTTQSGSSMMYTLFINWLLQNMFTIGLHTYVQGF